MMSNKKSQVDVALTIGAIIIPLGAIFGAMIFAWATIGPITDASKLAAVIAYDIGTLSDVAYSVPDDIRIFYKPPAQCTFEPAIQGNFRRQNLEFNNDYMSCINGFMNISGFYYAPEVRETKTKAGTENVMYFMKSVIGISLDPSKVDPGQDLKTFAPRVFGSSMDYGLMDWGRDIPLSVDKSVNIQKTRVGTFDTINVLYPKKTDALFDIVSKSLQACSSNTSKNLRVTIFPHNYIFKPKIAAGAPSDSSFLIPAGYTDNGQTLCLFRESQHPLPTNTSTMNYPIYCFDFTTANSGCIFDLTNFDIDTDTNKIGYPSSTKTFSTIVDMKVNCGDCSSRDYCGDDNSCSTCTESLYICYDIVTVS